MCGQIIKTSPIYKQPKDLTVKGFRFTITYCPGTQDVKPDALFLQYSPEVSFAEPEPILQSSFVVGATSWETVDVGKCQIRYFCQLYTASTTAEMKRAIGKMEGSIRSVEEQLMEHNTAEQRAKLG